MRGTVAVSDDDPTMCEYEVDEYGFGELIRVRGKRFGDFALRREAKSCIAIDDSGGAMLLEPGDFVIDHLPSRMRIASSKEVNERAVDVFIDSIAVELDGCANFDEIDSRCDEIGFHPYRKWLFDNQTAEPLTFRQWKRKRDEACDSDTNPFRVIYDARDKITPWYVVDELGTFVIGCGDEAGAHCEAEAAWNHRRKQEQGR